MEIEEMIEMLSNGPYEIFDGEKYIDRGNYVLLQLLMYLKERLQIDSKE